VRLVILLEEEKICSWLTGEAVAAGDLRAGYSATATATTMVAVAVVSAPGRGPTGS